MAEKSGFATEKSRLRDARRPAACRGKPVETVDASGRMVVPGFVNAGGHAAVLAGKKDPLDLYMLHVVAAGAARVERSAA